MAAGKKGIETTRSLLDVIGDAVRQVMSTSSGFPSNDLATFSGNLSDITITDSAVYLRLSHTMNRDKNGDSYEITARLVGHSGRWAIPPIGVVTEMMLTTARDADGFGCCWAMWGANAPKIPPKVMPTASQGIVYDFISDATLYLSRGLAHVFKSATGTTFGTDPTSGNFQITMANGTRFTMAQDAIELAVLDTASPPNVKSLLRLDRDGISLTSNGAVSAKWDGTNGSFTGVGNGGFYAAHSGGVLGPVGVLPIALGGGPGSIPSTNWKVAG